MDFFFFNTEKLRSLVKMMMMGPDSCGSMGWVLSHKVKGPQFDSWSRHMPGMRARSPVGGVGGATNQCFSHT